jgi:hypothetical protein
VYKIVALPAVALNEAMFPIPVAAMPIPGFELLQLTDAFGLVVKFIACTVFPSHNEILFKVPELGVVLTVMLKFIGKPEQPLYVGSNVMFPNELNP